MQSVPAPKQPVAPMSAIDTTGSTTLTAPVAPPPETPQSGSPMAGQFGTDSIPEPKLP